MNRNENCLDNAIFDCDKVEALMKSFEKTYICGEYLCADIEKANYIESAFYALWDAFNKVRSDLDQMADEKASAAAQRLK